MKKSNQVLKLVVVLLCSAIVVQAGLSDVNRRAAVNAICVIVSNEFGPITEAHLQDAFAQEVASGLETEHPSDHNADPNSACIVQPTFGSGIVEGVLVVYLTETTLKLTPEATKDKVDENKDFITREVFYPYDVTGLAFGFYKASKGKKKQEISRLFFVFTFAMKPSSVDLDRANQIKMSIFEKLELPAKLIDPINHKTDDQAVRCAMRLANNRVTKLPYELPPEEKILTSLSIDDANIDKTLDNLAETFSSAKEMAEFRALCLCDDEVQIVTLLEDAAGASTFVFPVSATDFTAENFELVISVAMEDFNNLLASRGLKDNIVGCGVSKTKDFLWQLIVVVIYQTTLFGTDYVPDIRNSNAEAMVLVTQWSKHSNAIKAFAELKRKFLFQDSEIDPELLTTKYGENHLAVDIAEDGTIFCIVCNAGTPYVDYPVAQADNLQ